ncbi:MAG: DUF1552 domain-containing protein [Planctomycetia bacterium]|nr:DUF1552 domain-containing protein [Planctomycetia bacterium]
MTRRLEISRRTVLRGLGAAVALPWLEAMAPAADLVGKAAAAASAPKRMAFLYVPNGAHMAAWTPEGEGTDFELPFILEPLKEFKDDLLVLSGLAQRGGEARGDGGGDHARSLASFLTGVHPLKTDSNIRAGVSVDQVAAQKVGKHTRFPSLELGIERGAQAGACDTGYSCAYSSNISWRTPTTPAGQLRNRLGTNDKRKMDEYLTAVRELEVRVANSETSPSSADLPDDVKRPLGIPTDYRDHVRLMADLMVLAFQGDVTRISTFMFANEGSTRPYPFIGVPEGHHDVSHHAGDPKKHEKIKTINRFHVEQFAYLLGKLKSVREGDGTLLDNVMIVYGSGIGDGNRHNHNDLPILLAGRGGGTIKTGRHVRYEKNTPLNNLYLSMLDRIGAPVDSLGESTGLLPNLDG